jgi:CBS domain containing-hemolysin-like protein
LFQSFPLFPTLFLLVLAAFFAATETTLFSLSRFQLRQLKQKNPERHARVRFLLDRPVALVSTILLGSELANVLVSNLVAAYYEDLHLSFLWVTVLNLITVVPIFMLFGEITPKVLGAKANMVLVNFLLPPFWWFYRLSFPVRFLLESIVNLLTRPIRKRGPRKEEHIKEEDVRILLEEGKRKGAIHSVEQDIIENLFEIDDDKVIDLATPISECLLVQQDESPKAVIEKLNRSFFARVPVYSGAREKIVGILYAKDLLKYIDRDDQEMKVRSLMKEPLFVEPGMKAEVLFRRFRQLKRHIAVVEAPHGKAVAVITMEDILEQMFGELWAEEK